MSEIDRLLAEPKPPALSAGFSQRVMANLPTKPARQEAVPKWMRAYWILFALFVIWQVASRPMPLWVVFALTPLLLVVLAMPGRFWVRLLSPMLR